MSLILDNNTSDAPGNKMSAILDNKMSVAPDNGVSAVPDSIRGVFDAARERIISAGHDDKDGCRVWTYLGVGVLLEYINEIVHPRSGHTSH